MTPLLRYADDETMTLLSYASGEDDKCMRVLQHDVMIDST
jgi:hypothetical protein